MVIVLLLLFRLSNKVGHLEGYLYRILDEATERAVVFLPGCLVDKFLYFAAVSEGFLDGVGVELLVLEQAFELCLCRFGMAVHQVIANNLLAVTVDVGRMLIHVKDIALFVADGDGDIREVFEIGIHGGNK